MLSLRLFLSRHVCTVLGCIYPSLASAKAAVQGDEEAFLQWAPYWIVASVLCLLEKVIFEVFVYSWLPLYPELKVLLLIWLTLPQFQGAAQLYFYIVHPYLEKYEVAIDGHLDQAHEAATKHIRRITSVVVEQTSRTIRNHGAAVLSGVGSNFGSQGMLSLALAAASSAAEHNSQIESRDMQVDAQHANDITRKLIEDTRLLLRGGIFLTVRQSISGVESSDMRLVTLETDDLLSVQNVHGADSPRNSAQYFMMVAAAANEDDFGINITTASGEFLVLELPDGGRDALLDGLSGIISERVSRT